MGPKGIACLLIAELKIFNPEREKRYRTACEKYSEKAVLSKMQELVERDYLDYGVSVRTAWLTPKGRATLALSLSDKAILLEFGGSAH